MFSSYITEALVRLLLWLRDHARRVVLCNAMLLMNVCLRQIVTCVTVPLTIQLI